MSGVPLPSSTLSPADTRKVQHVAVHAARATCMLKAEALLTSPRAGRPPGQSGHQRLFWLQLCTQGLLFALQPGKTKKNTEVSSKTMQEPQEMWVRSLGWEDPLEEETATHSSICARTIS